MEKKFLAYIAVGILVVIIAVIEVSPNLDFLTHIASQNKNAPSSLTAISASINPINIKYNGTSAVSVSDRDATLKTVFYVTNPNNATVILERMTYGIYGNGLVIGHGEIGQTYEGSLEPSNYYTLVEHSSTNVPGMDVIHNTGNNPDIWSALQKGTVKLTVAGTAFYSRKTAVSGQDFSADFDFTKS